MSSQHPITQFFNTHYPTIHTLSHSALTNHINFIDSLIKLPEQLNAYLKDGEIQLEQHVREVLDALEELLSDADETMWMNFTNAPTSFYSRLFSHLHTLQGFKKCLAFSVEQIIADFLMPIVKERRDALRSTLRVRHWGELPSVNDARQSMQQLETPKSSEETHQVQLFHEDLQKMRDLYMLQCLIWRLENMMHNDGEIASQSQYPHLWYIAELVHPFLMRFAFHFTGDKQSNAVEHPEMVTAFILSVYETYAPIIFKYGAQVVEESHTQHATFFNSFSITQISSDDAFAHFSHLILQPLIERFAKQLTLLKDTIDDTPDAMNLFIRIINEVLDMTRELQQEHIPMHVSALQELLTANPWVLQLWARIDREQLLKVLKPNLLDWASSGKQEVDRSIPTVSTAKFMHLLESLHQRCAAVDDLQNRTEYIKRSIVHLLDVYLQYVTDLEDLPNLVDLKGNSSEAEENEEIWREYCRKLNSIRFIVHQLNLWSQEEYILEIMSTPHDDDKRDVASSSESLDESTLNPLQDAIESYELAYNQMLKHLMKQLLQHLKRYLATTYNDQVYIQQITLMMGSKSTHAMFMLCERVEMLLRVLREECNTQDWRIIWQTFARQLDDFLFTEYQMGEVDMEIDQNTVTLAHDLYALVYSVCPTEDDARKYLSQTLKFCETVLAEHDIEKEGSEHVSDAESEDSVLLQDDDDLR